MTRRHRGRSTVAPRRLGQIGAAAVAGGGTVALVAWTVGLLSGRGTTPWLLGRAAGLTAYLVMVALALLGLGLADPRRARRARLDRVTRIRLHLGLAVFLLLFTVGHVVVLALDGHAGVGWAGAVLPLASDYRPVPVTLGVLAAEAAAVAAGTALLAGRVLGRHWAIVHRASVMIMASTWLHAVLAGSDTGRLRWLYLATGLVVVVRAGLRYVAPAPGAPRRARRGNATPARWVAW